MANVNILITMVYIGIFLFLQCMFFSNAGEVACDFEAKKEKVIQTMVEADKPKSHDWWLLHYDTHRLFLFTWYISILYTSNSC